jgi:enoyl-CoA hydratase/carnithine racemase
VDDLVPPTLAVTLLEELAEEAGGEAPGAAWGRPLLVVGLPPGADGPDLPVSAHLASVVVVVATGVPPVHAPGGADVYLADPGPADLPAPWVAPAGGAVGALQHLRAVVDAHPLAAAILVQVLRAGAGLGRAEATAVESLAYGLLQGGADHHRWLAAQRSRRPAVGPPLRLERRGDHLEVTLTRPERRNPFDTGLRDALAETVALAAADSSITEVRLRGEGPCFCSGGDLAEFGRAPDPAAAHAVRMSRPVGLLLGRLPTRTVVDLHGPCLGAGIEIPAFADVVSAAPGTTLTLPEVAMGLIPGAGGTVSITERIGRHRTAWLALSGWPLDVGTAHRWGLVDRIAELRPSGPRAPRSVDPGNGTAPAAWTATAGDEHREGSRDGDAGGE